jgi:hypothetical protein
MSEWWSYTIADFLMYSARTWYRLIEHHNTAVWPAQLAALLLGLGIMAAVIRQPPWQARAIPAALAFLWAFVAIAFLWRRYSGISTGATWFAAGFGIEALLLAWVGARRHLDFLPPHGLPGWVGFLLLALAVVLYPSFAVLAGRGIRQAEVFGVMPDPTAIGTIGVLLMATGRWRRRLMMIPVLWCLVSGSLYWALHQADGRQSLLQPAAPHFAVKRTSTSTLPILPVPRSKEVAPGHLYCPLTEVGVTSVAPVHCGVSP